MNDDASAGMLNKGVQLGDLINAIHAEADDRGVLVSTVYHAAGRYLAVIDRATKMARCALCLADLEREPVIPDDVKAGGFIIDLCCQCLTLARSEIGTSEARKACAN